jgi:hypothetical protein
MASWCARVFHYAEYRIGKIGEKAAQYIIALREHERPH